MRARLPQQPRARRAQPVLHAPLRRPVPCRQYARAHVVEMRGEDPPSRHANSLCSTTLPWRAKKDPRDLRILDPACGSGHFPSLRFDLLTIYDEAWHDDAAPRSSATGSTLQEELRGPGPAAPRAASVGPSCTTSSGSRSTPGRLRSPACPLAPRPARVPRVRSRLLSDPPSDERTSWWPSRCLAMKLSWMRSRAENYSRPCSPILFRRMSPECASLESFGTLLRVDDAIAITLTEARDVRQASDYAAPPWPRAAAVAGGARPERDRRRPVLRGGGGDAPRGPSPLL